jgi:5'-3' exonuclease
LAVFVGNDFLLNLLDLHIHENGLERLFDIYKKVLPGLGMWSSVRLFNLITHGCVVLDGYINESGINTRRLQVTLDEMVSWEQEIFEKEYSDMNSRASNRSMSKMYGTTRNRRGLESFFAFFFPYHSESRTSSLNSVEQCPAQDIRRREGICDRE